MKPVPGICDRCSFRFNLSGLLWETERGRRTGLRVCPKCFDEEHPQEDTYLLRIDDKQAVRDPRPQRDLTAARELTDLDYLDTIFANGVIHPGADTPTDPELLL